MAAESLFGGTDTTGLSDGTKGVLDLILGDTVGGTVTTSQVGSGTLVVGTGAGGVIQGALIGSNGTVVAGEVNAGVLDMTVVLPEQIGLAFQGLDAVPVDQSTAYFASLVDQYLPANSTDPGTQALRDNLLEALNDMRDALAGGTGVTSVSVRFVWFTDSTLAQASTATRETASNDVVFDAGTAAAGRSEALALMLTDLGPNKTLILKHVEAALLIGAGTVRVDNSDGIGAFLTGDVFNQAITGGTGNDTLIGGGGRDTLTGGAGADTFGIDGRGGHVVITDFKLGTDHMAFTGAGMNTVGGMLQHVTGVTQQGADVVVHFGSDTSVTLVGISAEQLTLDMVKFTL